MTPAQSRAARGLLNWDLDRVAASAGVDAAAIRDFETEKQIPLAISHSIQRAFERAGIEFLNDGAPGVRQRPAPGVLRLDELNASNDE